MDVHDELKGLLLDPGPGPEVASFIARERDGLNLRRILEETFRRIDLGPRDLVCSQGAFVSPEVGFILRHGGRFSRRGLLNKLLEDTYRYIELGPPEFKRRAGACLSPEIDFLFTEGASFREVPCGLSRLVKATTEYLQQSDRNKANFLFQHQQATHNKINSGWYIFLSSVYESLLKCVDNETLCRIVWFTSNHQREIKIYTTPFKTNGLCRPLVTLKEKDENWLINASIAELRGRSDKVTIIVQGRELKVLRLLLEARSTCFKKLIDGKLDKRSLTIDGSYKTIQFVALYAQSEPNDDSLWLESKPCDSRDTTENTLDELINILHAAITFEMADLFGAVEQHIIMYGHSFIYAKNAQEIKVIANELKAVFLERYCDAFIATNLRTFTIFPSLPTELRTNIWRQMASQPQLVLAHRLGGDSGIPKLEIPSHIDRISEVCRDSNAEVQQFWGGPSLDGINFKFDIIWLDTHYFPLSMNIESLLKGAHYSATPAPYPSLGSEWEFEVDKIIKCCPHVKVLYLETKIVSRNDEIEYCRKFINREPATLADARRWIEESAHQRILELRRDSQDETTKYLPRIMLIDNDEISRRDRFHQHYVNRPATVFTGQY